MKINHMYYLSTIIILLMIAITIKIRNKINKTKNRIEKLEKQGREVKLDIELLTQKFDGENEKIQHDLQLILDYLEVEKYQEPIKLVKK